MEGIGSKVTNTSERLCLQDWRLEQFLLKLEGTLEAGPCRWLPGCLPRGEILPEELVMGKIADFGSESCVERRDSLSLRQWKDQRDIWVVHRFTHPE